MHVAYPVAGPTGPPHGTGDRAPGGTPADHEQVRVLDARHLGIRDLYPLHPGPPQVDHVAMVFRVVADVAGSVFFLDTADAVHEPRRSRDRPLAGQEVVAKVGPKDAISVLVGLVGPSGELHRDWCQRRQVWDPPRLGAVGQVPVGEQDHRGAVGKGDPGCLDRHVEAVGRGVG